MPDYRRAARRAARRHGLNPTLFERQIAAESGFNPRAVSPAGARGIAQFMPATAKGMGVNLYDRRVMDDLEGAARLMANYVRKYGSFAKALEAYNAGPGGVGKGYAETRAYVAKVMRGGGDQTAIRRALERGEDEPRRQGARTRLVRETIPGVNREAERQAVMRSYLEQRGHPEALLSLASGLQAAQDIPGRTVRRRERVPGSRAGGRRGGRVMAGGGYAGTQKLADASRPIAERFGVAPSSEKRPRRLTATGNVSDHYEGNRQAYAIDYDTPGNDSDVGHKLARSLARRYGVGYRPNSYDSGGTIRSRGGTYRVQILYGSGVGHGDHVHLGIRRVR